MKEIRDTMKSFQARYATEPAELHCGSMEALLERLNKVVLVERHEAPNGIAMLYGMRVVEKSYMPRDRAALVSADGKILAVIDLTETNEAPPSEPGTLEA